MSKLPIEKKAGAVIFGRYDGGFSFALVHDVFGYWTLSKGGVEEAEESASCTCQDYLVAATIVDEFPCHFDLVLDHSFWHVAIAKVLYYAGTEIGGP